MAKNFYEQWLETPNRLQDELEVGRLVAADKDIPWVSTPQDVKVKLMVANHLGFADHGQQCAQVGNSGWLAYRQASATVKSRCTSSRVRV
jgi:hypothetical protein